MIDGVTAVSTTKEPAVIVFQGSRVSILNSRLKSEFSSATHIDKTAGDQTTIVNSVVDGGGVYSKALIDVQGGKNHLIKCNRFLLRSGSKETRISPAAEADTSDNAAISK